MNFEITFYEVNMYIRDYRMNNNGEYPAPTKKSEKKLNVFLKQKKLSIESRERLKILRQHYISKGLTEKLNAMFIETGNGYGINHIDIVSDETGRWWSLDYKETIKDHLEKKRPRVFEKYLKTRMNGMKRELLETSAKICMNPARIQRLLDENILDLDDTSTFYDL